MKLFESSCGEKTKPNKANRGPLAGCRRPDDDGRRGGWMMDGSALVNRLSFFLYSDRRPSAAVGKEKLFAAPVL